LQDFIKTVLNTQTLFDNVVNTLASVENAILLREEDFRKNTARITASGKLVRSIKLDSQTSQPAEHKVMIKFIDSRKYVVEKSVVTQPVANQPVANQPTLEKVGEGEVRKIGTEFIIFATVWPPL